MQLKMPRSTVLRWLIGWMIFATLLKIERVSQADHLTTEQSVAYFLGGLVFKYLFGAFWSGFPFIYVTAMIAAAVFVIAVTTRGPRSRDAANLAFGTILMLSLFCIWIEPWLSAFGLIANVLLILFGLFSVVVELCVSGGWFVLWAMAHDALTTEL